MLPISGRVSIPLDEIEFVAVRAQGPGGQHVNKTSTAIQLRFDIRASSLPEPIKERLLNLSDHRITEDGVVLIRARQQRSQQKNREAALSRLQQLVRGAVVTPRKRRPTRPSRASQERRLQRKKQRGQIKKLRGDKPEVE